VPLEVWARNELSQKSDATQSTQHKRARVAQQCSVLDRGRNVNNLASLSQLSLQLRKLSAVCGVSSWPGHATRGYAISKSFMTYYTTCNLTPRSR
jgi:hypothetical protein